MEEEEEEEISSMEVNSPRVLKVLEALKQASHDIQTHPDPKSLDPNLPSAIKALLELENESDTLLSRDPNLFTLSQHLADLKSLMETLHNSRGYSIRKFLARRVSTHSISKVAGSIESEIQAWIDRESVENLARKLKDSESSSNCDAELVGLLTQFEERVSLGFNRSLQDLIIKFKLFVLLEQILSDPNRSQRLRDRSASAIASLIGFNKDVFVGQVLMGKTIPSLVTMASVESIRVLCSLIKRIKSPLVDEIESNGEIPKIISLLDYKDLQMKLVSMDCILEIAYFGRKEAIDAMLNEGLVKKLVELQRSEIGGNLIELERFQGESGETKFLQKHPFASCVARFAVQLEVGEGLRQREKRAFKQAILVRVKEASVSHAEASTIIAEVLWGSSP